MSTDHSPASGFSPVAAFRMLGRALRAAVAAAAGVLGTGALLSVLYSIGRIQWFRATSDYCAAADCSRAVQAEPDVALAGEQAMESAGLSGFVTVAGYGFLSLVVVVTGILFSVIAIAAAMPWLGGRRAGTAVAVAIALTATVVVAGVVSFDALLWFANVVE